MIDLEHEALVTIAEAPRLIPSLNAVPGMEARKPLHSRTVYNWSVKGKRGVVLETAMIGGILATSREALLRFFSRLAAARESRMADPAHSMTTHRSVASRKSQQSRERLSSEHRI